MPLFPKRSVEPEPTHLSLVKAEPTSIVSAATRITSNRSGTLGAPFRINNSAWSTEAWRQYDVCGELHFATTWLANSTSRCRFVVSDKDDQGRVSSIPTKNVEVTALVKGLIANPGLQAELLRMATINMTIVGDGYLLGEVGDDGEFSRWTFLSIMEVSIGIANQIIVNTGDGLSREIDVNEVLLMRVHRPHPRKWWEADSPTRAALPILRELEELSKYLFATINSRLSGAGILGMPSEMTFPLPTQEILPGQSPFMSMLTDAFLRPIEDMSDPGAVVPIVIEAPREALAGITWITNPNGNLTTTVSDLRKAAIERLALSLDLSPDTLFGTGNASRWGQWTIEEQSIKFHIEPVMILLCGALNAGWLVPLLTAAGIDPSKFQVWYDASDLVQQADQATGALSLYDRGELSGAALRRETGFSEADAPEGVEANVRDLLKLVALAPTVGYLILPELAKLWGIEIDLSSIGPDPTGTPPQPEAPPENVEPRNTDPEPPAQPKTTPNKDGKQPAQR